MIRTEVLQINLNRNWRAQSILDQNMVENKIGACIISEPIKFANTWFSRMVSLQSVVNRSFWHISVLCLGEG